MMTTPTRGGAARSLPSTRCGRTSSSSPRVGVLAGVSRSAQLDQLRERPPPLWCCPPPRLYAPTSSPPAPHAAPPHTPPPAKQSTGVLDVREYAHFDEQSGLGVLASATDPAEAEEFEIDLNDSEPQFLKVCGVGGLGREG